MTLRGRTRTASLLKNIVNKNNWAHRLSILVDRVEELHSQCEGGKKMKSEKEEG